MDVTFRNLDDELFRKFKAKCAETDVPMGAALNFAMREWLKRWAASHEQERASSPHSVHVDLSPHSTHSSLVSRPENSHLQHNLRDMSSHVTSLSEAHAKGIKRAGKKGA